MNPATDLYWISWNQHGAILGVEHLADSRPASWPPPERVIAFWETGSGGGLGIAGYCTMVALVRAANADAAMRVVLGAWSPGVGEWRFNREYGKDTPPGDRFPPPSWSIKLGRWPWKKNP